MVNWSGATAVHGGRLKPDLYDTECSSGLGGGALRELTLTSLIICFCFALCITNVGTNLGVPLAPLLSSPLLSSPLLSSTPPLPPSSPPLLSSPFLSSHPLLHAFFELRRASCRHRL